MTRTLIHRDLADVLADLPPAAALYHITDKTPIMVRRGHRGFWKLPDNFPVDAYNMAHNVSPAHREAMEIGSIFGFDVPGADPLNHLDLNSPTRDPDAVSVDILIVIEL